MCGFNSIFHYNSSLTVDLAELRATRDHMHARGPDGFGEWVSDDGRVGFGHRRLSIIDLSDRGAQPMHSVDGRYSITFNGEIYNYRPLRETLLRDGWSLRSETDTEVLMGLYARHGADMLPMLRGMFAFALWDHERKQLFAARDPYGIKPLYYADDGGCIRMASQVKALLAGGAVDARVDEGSLCAFLMLGSVPEPRSIYRAVRALPAGHWLRVDGSGVKGPVEYGSIAGMLAEAAPLLRGEGGKTSPPAPLLEEETIREALRDSVAHHMIADVPVGAFLSAGIDSGTLVGLVRDAGIEDLRTVTLAFEEFRGRHDDEAPLAEDVARHYGTDHRTRMLTAQEFSGDLDHILAVMDQPSIDGINTYYVSKAARENGLKVALSGLGGDELFAGYNTFVDVPEWVRKFGFARRLPWLGQGFQSVYASLLSGHSERSPKVAGALKYGHSYPGAWYLRRGLFMPWELPELLGVDRAEAGLHDMDIMGLIGDAMTPDPVTPYGRIAAMEAGLYMKNQLLRDSDWAGMAHSIEIRVPLVDIELLRRLAPLMHTLALTHRKRLLAMSPSRPIPQQLLDRRKTGFQVPIRHWLEQDERIDTWKRVPTLVRANWERRWAYVLADRMSKE
ncbi:MAG: asparagine synthase (glutamine-hydrolyzing) [Bacteroidia bacterium]|nr:asparagine synthase (glutamine-hydrolyzing) [Bacteroidia bacterium]